MGASGPNAPAAPKDKFLRSLQWKRAVRRTAPFMLCSSTDK
ncbi:hypothetical protein [Azospirillum endophyticum]